MTAQLIIMHVLNDWIVSGIFCAFKFKEMMNFLCLDLYRPVLVIGALSEWVVDKLISDFPEQFHRCIVNQMRCSKEEIEMRLNNNQIIEYRRRGSLFECVSLEAAKDNKVWFKLNLVIKLN